MLSGVGEVFVLFVWFVFFFSSTAPTPSPEYLHLFGSIPLSGKMLAATVNAYLGKDPRPRADLRENS